MSGRYQEAQDELITAMSGAMAAMFFCMEPETWPVFLEWCGRMEGSDWSGMDIANMKFSALVVAKFMERAEAMTVTTERVDEARRLMREAGLFE